MFVREQKEYLFMRGPVSLEPHWSITARRFPFGSITAASGSARASSSLLAVAY